jgi:hypothetical protein
VTEKGRLSLAPRGVREGDTVCLVLGGEVPLLLRRDGSDAEYTFAGGCYLHGYMDGEGLLEIGSQVDPSHDPADKAFMHRLHLETSPLKPQIFCIK